MDNNIGLAGGIPMGAELPNLFTPPPPGGGQYGTGPQAPGRQMNLAAGTKLDDMAAIRDSISALAAAGYNGSKMSEGLRGHASRILGMLPADVAHKLLTHLALQGQREGTESLSPAARLQRFYDIESSDPATNAILQRAKAFGTGPMSAFRETPDIVSQQLAAMPIASK